MTFHDWNLLEVISSSERPITAKKLNVEACLWAYTITVQKQKTTHYATGVDYGP